MADLIPYRVDQDAAVQIPIDSIHQKIRDAEICLAEISLDNPNVWYELGYALAIGKEVIFVCENGKRSKFPFDVSHRHIIQYELESEGDYAATREIISAKLRARSPSSVLPQDETAEPFGVELSERNEAKVVNLLFAVYEEMKTMRVLLYPFRKVEPKSIYSLQTVYEFVPPSLASILEETFQKYLRYSMASLSSGTDHLADVLDEASVEVRNFLNENGYPIDWSLTDAIGDPIIRDLNLRLKNSSWAANKRAEYEFKVGKLNETITICLFKLENGWYAWEQSHFIKTPVQIGPYRPSRPAGDYMGYALHLAAQSLTSYYREAIESGHEPSETWLISNEHFERDIQKTLSGDS